MAQRIRSDAFRDVGVSTRDVDVAVEDGVATLRGTLPSDGQADELVRRVGKVPGGRRGDPARLRERDTLTSR